MRPPLILAAIAAATPLAAAPAAAPPALAPEWRQSSEEPIRLRLTSIEPGVIRLRAGAPARLSFYNETPTTLGVSLGGLAADRGEGEQDGVDGDRLRVEPGETRTVTVVPRAGRYRIRSSNWFRRLAGMSTLVIVEDAPPAR